jgi:hypothetical protein
MNKHCMCCNCVRLYRYEALNSQDEQIAFLLNLNTLDRLQLIVNDKSFTYVDELLTETKVIDMKKLLYHIKARFNMTDCDDLHTFTDIADKHIDEICKLIAKYIIFQIDILDDYFDLHVENAVKQNEQNFEILKYMFADECEFILNSILQTNEQKENYVNTLMRRYFIYQDCFKQYVSSETIKHFVDFHH